MSIGLTCVRGDVMRLQTQGDAYIPLAGWILSPKRLTDRQKARLSNWTSSSSSSLSFSDHPGSSYKLAQLHPYPFPILTSEFLAVSNPSPKHLLPLPLTSVLLPRTTHYPSGAIGLVNAANPLSWRCFTRTFSLCLLTPIAQP